MSFSIGLTNSERFLMTKVFPRLVLLSVIADAHVARAQHADCPTNVHTVFIRKGVNDNPQILIANLRTRNTTVLLAPDVDIDFGDPLLGQGGRPLIHFGRCVTLGSYIPDNGPVATGRTRIQLPTAQPPVAVSAVERINAGSFAGFHSPLTSARTPHSLGPVLRYGTHAADPAFIDLHCEGDPNADDFSEGARISGIRLFGPNFDDHATSETGINVSGCKDVEISNMETAGWGNAAISVDNKESACDNTGTHCSVPGELDPRMSILIHDNYIHHNQHSTQEHGAVGYGVAVLAGAFVDIDQNVFDFNRHAITAASTAGGYRARRNLVLKGGGFHGSFFERDIHQFDVHGSANCPVEFDNLPGGPWANLFAPGLAWLYDDASDASHKVYNCGDAGFSFLFEENAFQYKKTEDISIRGKPAGTALAMTRITGNIFARTKGDAIHLDSPDSVVVDDTKNRYNLDTFGQYGVCDLDGDGADDLFLATGITWWFSSAGKYPWSFLKRDTAELKDVKLGDVDGDGRCDIVKDAALGTRAPSTGVWMISSGGAGDWRLLGGFLAPLADIHLGRFGLNDANHAAVDRRITHAFRRRTDGQWLVTPLSNPDGTPVLSASWKPVASSSFPLNQLQFGDFNGDGITDVLAVVNGRWSTSQSARLAWHPLNPLLTDPISRPNMFIGNLDAGDRIDDVLRLDREVTPGGQHGVPTNGELTKLSWQRSVNGTQRWLPWKEYAWVYPTDVPDYVPPSVGFVGKFSVSSPACTLVIDPGRFGHFACRIGAAPQFESVSLFAY